MQNIGGQAVIEGVMMKAPGGWTVAVRDPKGTIHLKREVTKPLPKALKFPIMRGVVALWEALSIGIRALEFSAMKAADEDKPEEALTAKDMVFTMVAAFLLAAGLFIALPLLAAKLLGMVLPIVKESNLAFNLADGLVRVVVFVLYVYVIGLWADMRRVFEYHGAEHKVIHAYESGKGMTIDAIRSFSPIHPRCGTSFLMIVMAVSILVFSFIPKDWPMAYKFLSRLVLIPLIAGVSYETLKLSAKLCNNPIIKFFMMPGLLMQRLTTREPDDKQIEVALTALNEALAFEGADKAEICSTSSHQ